MAKKRIHVLSNTHWDREHRHGFQETRIMLVELLDRLIEIMESDPDFKYYTLDGQAIMVDDYLAVKPHMRDRLAELIRQGRILIGPWYSLVDASSADPEAVVRNLLIGDRFCREYGAPMRFGYSIFSFGQIAQLPQIYAGFDIENIIFYKGYSDKRFKIPEFIWRAPDGSKALTSKLTKFHRVNFFVHFSVPVILGGDMLAPGWQATLTNGNKVCHANDMQHCQQHAQELEPDIRVRPDRIEQAVHDLLQEVSASKAEHVFLAFDGIDFSTPLADIPQALQLANQRMGEKAELVHSHINDYIREFREEVPLDSLQEYEGELRFGPVWKVHTDSMSANIDLKQKLCQAERTLIGYAEPFSTLAVIQGMALPRDLLKVAWKYLLQSHCHDSVHGLGVPKIKSDTLYRLDQVQEIGQSLTMRVLQRLVADIDTSTLADDDIAITVFNPTAHERSEIMELVVDLPQEEYVRDYSFIDQDDQQLDYYENRRYDHSLAVVNPENRPKSLFCDRVEVSLDVRDVPAMGYKTLKVRRVPGDVHSTRMPFPPPRYPQDPIAQAPDLLDNGLVRLRVESNGTITLEDLETGYIAEGLNTFIDSGCAGDMWVHREPEQIDTLTSVGSAARICVVKNSCLCATLRVETVMEIPVCLTEDRKARRSETIATRIVTEITLRRYSKRVDFRVQLDNQCRDHKLVAVFPTGLHAETVASECPFEVRRRRVNPITQGALCDEQLRHHAMRRFVDVAHEGSGLALFSQGLMEYEVESYPYDGVRLKLTLLRAVTQTFPLHEDVFQSFPDEPAQCLGRHVFEYALLPHEHGYQDAGVIAESRDYYLPLLAMQYGKGKLGRQPTTYSFVKLSHPNTMISCLKIAEDSPMVVLRLNNPTDVLIPERLQFGRDIKRACLLNLNEQELSPLPALSRSVDVMLEPFKIVTIGLEF